jgi:hypothetical protein
VDETALFWKQIPKEIFAFKNKNVSSSKKSKERVTISVRKSMIG